MGKLTLLFVGALLLGGSIARVALWPALEPVRAGTAVRMDVADLTRGAARIVEGRVLSSEVVAEPGARRISTHYELELERTLLGPTEWFTSVVFPGGILPDGSGKLVAGIPRLAVGERVLLFLCEPSGEAQWTLPVGLGQGKWRVMARADGGKDLWQGGEGMSLVVPGEAGHRHGVGVLRDYAEVLAEVHAALASREDRGR